METEIIIETSDSFATVLIPASIGDALQAQAEAGGVTLESLVEDKLAQLARK